MQYLVSPVRCSKGFRTGVENVCAGADSDLVFLNPLLRAISALGLNEQSNEEKETRTKLNPYSYSENSLVELKQMFFVGYCVTVFVLPQPWKYRSIIPNKWKLRKSHGTSTDRRWSVIEVGSRLALLCLGNYGLAVLH